jgi:hypothetical protein
MPASGGAADKLGNRYEALWAIDQLLKIVDGYAVALTLEPLELDESRGIEFRVEMPDVSLAYWSVKRQRAGAAGWTPAELVREDALGRSILGDLRDHVERATKHRGVFASTQAATALDELRFLADDAAAFADRLSRNKELKSEFEQRIMPLCDGERERSRTLLSRIATHACDETKLREDVEFAARKLFRVSGDSSFDPAALRLHLGDLLEDRIHRRIDRDTILHDLEGHGYHLRDLAHDNSVIDRIRELTNAYYTPTESRRIAGRLLPLAESDKILRDGEALPVGRVLVVGPAGGGKTTTLAGIVAGLSAAGIPVLALRFDIFPDGLLTTADLGQKLGLPVSPVLALDGLARGRPSVLVLDQLDAISIASGRRADLWTLFEGLAREASHCETMSLVVGCREFDIENDRRMKALKADKEGYRVVHLRPLSPQQIDSVLLDVGMSPAFIHTNLKPLLGIPLHLWMFLTLGSKERIGLADRDQLFDAFWSHAGQRCEQRREPAGCRWNEVLERLVPWLNDTQQLTAPRHVLDGLDDDARVMASENVLILEDDRYQFFHESFFDYAFARQFARSRDTIVDMLLGGEQALFRRAQVRQVLSFLRGHDPTRYRRELAALLVCDGVRFHIKKLVFQWMAALSGPELEEWRILSDLIGTDPSLRPHVMTAVAGNPGWFDVLDGAGYFDGALASGDDKQEEEAIWLLSKGRILRSRSCRVAALVQTHRRPGAPWDGYLRTMCRFGDAFHSPEMFELFLSLIEDGTLDPGVASAARDDERWHILRDMAKQKPDLASRAIAKWFDRTVDLWRAARDSEAGQESPPSCSLADELDRSDDGGYVVREAARAAGPFVELLFPRIVSLVAELAEVECPDHLSRDPVWQWRHYGVDDDFARIHEALLHALATAMESFAKSDPAGLTRVISPAEGCPHDTVTYLLLRAWTAAPEHFADKLADYLVRDARRLDVGYAISGGGWIQNLVSMKAIAAATSACTPDRLAALEEAVMTFREAPRYMPLKTHGLLQLKLLSSFEASRLSPKVRRRLQELQRKFPEDRAEKPYAIRMGAIGSPVPQSALVKGSDADILGAMKAYAGVDTISRLGSGLEGGERQLANALEERAKEDPRRFLELATHEMQEDLPATYFNAVIRGIVKAGDRVTIDEVESLIRRVHTLPGKPCGRWLAWLVRDWGHRNWSDKVVTISAWYAMNDPDPDPERELWTGDSPCYGGRALDAGINSTRGAMASAIARLLFDDNDRFKALRDAVDSLVHDRSTAVRCCAIEILLAISNIDLELATKWFSECVSADDVILSTPGVDRFLYHAGFRDYARVRPVLRRMLQAKPSEVVEAASRVVTLIALSRSAATDDAEDVRSGTATMRKAAADVYATNIAQAEVGSTCRELLKPFFQDPELDVRRAAASAFRHMNDLSTSNQAALLEVFLNSSPSKEVLGKVVQACEDSPVRFPDLLCDLAEACMYTFSQDAADPSKRATFDAMGLSKVVVRLCTETESAQIRKRCLDMIDEMGRFDFVGIERELETLER